MTTPDATGLEHFFSSRTTPMFSVMIACNLQVIADVIARGIPDVAPADVDDFLADCWSHHADALVEMLWRRISMQPALRPMLPQRIDVDELLDALARHGYFSADVRELIRVMRAPTADA